MDTVGSAPSGVKLLKTIDGEAPPLAGLYGLPGRSSPLPCLKSNNSIRGTGQGGVVRLSSPDWKFALAREKLGPTGGTRVAQQALRKQVCPADVMHAIADAPIESHTKQGRFRLILPDGEEFAFGVANGAEKKAAFALVENVKALSRAYGVERLGFLTLTFKDQVTDVKEAQRRFNSLCSNFLRDVFADWIVIVEPQTKRRGTVHYHLVVVCETDIRTGFDWDGLDRRDYSSANATLKGYWTELRAAMPRYGFGRHELLPIRSTEEGIARYVGKYLHKGLGLRLEGWEGARMVRYSRRTKWRAAGCSFSWATSSWRQRVRQVAEVLQAEDLDQLSVKAGKRWAFTLLSLLQADPELTAETAARVMSKLHIERA